MRESCLQKFFVGKTVVYYIFELVHVTFIPLILCSGLPGRGLLNDFFLVVCEYIRNVFYYIHVIVRYCLSHGILYRYGI